MPRRGRSASPPPASRRQMATSRPAAPVQQKAAAPVPAAHAPSAVAPPMAAPSAGGGMMANIATTAAGVAIGSTVGHALTGMFSGSSDAPAAHQDHAPAAAQHAPVPMASADQSQSGPCAWEIRQFLQCAQESSELSYCDGFNEAMRQCKSANRI